jgi:hypothetical protein
MSVSAIFQISNPPQISPAIVRMLDADGTDTGTPAVSLSENTPQTLYPEVSHKVKVV